MVDICWLLLSQPDQPWRMATWNLSHLLDIRSVRHEGAVLQRIHIWRNLGSGRGSRRSRGSVSLIDWLIDCFCFCFCLFQLSQSDDTRPCSVRYGWDVSLILFWRLSKRISRFPSFSSTCNYASLLLFFFLFLFSPCLTSIYNSMVIADLPPFSNLTLLPDLTGLEGRPRVFPRGMVGQKDQTYGGAG